MRSWISEETGVAMLKLLESVELADASTRDKVIDVDGLMAAMCARICGSGIVPETIAIDIITTSSYLLINFDLIAPKWRSMQGQ